MLTSRKYVFCLIKYIFLPVLWLYFTIIVSCSRSHRFWQFQPGEARPLAFVSGQCIGFVRSWASSSPRAGSRRDKALVQGLLLLGGGPLSLLLCGTAVYCRPLKYPEIKLLQLNQVNSKTGIFPTGLVILSKCFQEKRSFIRKQGLAVHKCSFDFGDPLQVR